MPVIDADCHVIESDRTWEYMDAADEPYHPVPLPRLENGPDRARWDIQGRPAIRSATVTRARASRQSLSGHEQTTAAARTLSDIEARLGDPSRTLRTLRALADGGSASMRARRRMTKRTIGDEDGA